jgi:drug/metabolite transporter (DMT)-like permease
VLALAGAAALCFGLSLYATGRISSDLPVAWLVLPARLVGTALVAIPLLGVHRLRLASRAAPLVAAAGACEVLGIASYSLGARHGIAVAAVVSCQFAAIAALVAFVLFGERLGRVQLAGVSVLLVGVSLLSAIRG